MAAQNKSLVDGVRPPTTAETLVYTSPANGAGTRITAFTASNDTGTTETYTVFVTPSGTTASSNKIVPSNAVLGNDTDTHPDIINHLVPPGGTIVLQVSTGNTVAFRVTGIEFT